jgi:hypothetical protein
MFGWKMNKTMNIDDDVTMKDKDTEPGLSGNKANHEAKQTKEPVPDAAQEKETAGEGMNLNDHEKDEKSTTEVDEKNKCSNNTNKSTSNNNSTDSAEQQSENTTKEDKNTRFNDEVGDDAGWQEPNRRKKGKKTTATTANMESTTELTSNIKTGEFGENSEGSTYRLGIRVSGIGPTGKTRWTALDIVEFLEVIQKIDSKATIYNSANQPKSAIPINSVSNIKNCTEYFNITTNTWGKRSEDKERTVWTCYVQSDIIKPGLRELRDNVKIQKILGAGKCTIYPHSLLQSQSAVAGYIFGKDPKHTNRKELENRLKQHFAGKNLAYPPFQIDTSNVKVSSSTTKICTIFVGRNDEDKMKKMLQNYPCKYLEVVSASVKRNKPNEFVAKMTQHQIIVQNSRAIKLENLSNNHVDQLHKWRYEDDMTTKVIDVARAGRFMEKGVVYVQYLFQSKQEVIKWINKRLEILIGACQGQDPEPRLASSNDSVAPSAVTNITNGPGIPESPFDSLFCEGGLFHQFEVQVPVKNQNEGNNQGTTFQYGSWVAAVKQETKGASPTSSVTGTQNNKSKHSNLSEETKRKLEEYDSVIEENRQLKDTINEHKKERAELKELVHLQNNKIETMEQTLNQVMNMMKMNSTGGMPHPPPYNVPQSNIEPPTGQHNTKRNRYQRPPTVSGRPSTTPQSTPTKSPDPKRLDKKSTPTKSPPPTQDELAPLQTQLSFTDSSTQQPPGSQSTAARGRSNV